MKNTWIEYNKVTNGGTFYKLGCYIRIGHRQARGLQLPRAAAPTSSAPPPVPSCSLYLVSLGPKIGVLWYSQSWRQMQPSLGPEFGALLLGPPANYSAHTVLIFFLSTPYILMLLITI